MTSPELILNAIKDLSNNQELDRYGENLCNDIAKKIDSKLKDAKMKIEEKTIFARNNFMVMDKWAEVFSPLVTECLREYFRNKVGFASGFDPRFPNTNHAKKCFVNFVDYQRCIRLKGEEHLDCDYFKQHAYNICPNAWIEKFSKYIIHLLKD